MCGILAVIANHEITSFEFINILQNIQHRGQDSSGIAYIKNDTIETRHKTGLVKKLHNIDNIVNSDIYLDATNLPRGVYFLKAFQTNTLTIVKIIKD